MRFDELRCRTTRVAVLIRISVVPDVGRENEQVVALGSKRFEETANVCRRALGAKDGNPEVRGQVGDADPLPRFEMISAHISAGESPVTRLARWNTLKRRGNETTTTA